MAEMRGLQVDWTADDGAALRLLREQRGMTQRDISLATGVTTAAISGWERGESRPRRDNAAAFGKAVGDLDAALAICGYSAAHNQSNVNEIAALRADLTTLQAGLSDAQAEIESLTAMVVELARKTVPLRRRKPPKPEA